MNRRDFSRKLAAGSLALGAVELALAQGAPVEGQDFQRLPKDVPPVLPSAQKKVEVVEFFWYGCGHCFAFEPTLQAWAAQVPPDVYFHRIPYALLGPAEHQKMFYALEELGQLDALHRKIFDAIHVQQKRLNSESEIVAFVAANGVDGARFSAAMKSFSVVNKLTRGRQLAAAYKIESVPTLGVQGRWLTSPSMAGSHERALGVTNMLVQRSRQGV